MIKTCLFCQGHHFEQVFDYTAPPEGEVVFDFSSSGAYSRQLICCHSCGHYYSTHTMDMSALYEGAYVDATYKQGLKKTFDRINALPPEQSDNVARVKRIIAFAEKQKMSSSPRLLDIGSGLTVFPYRMKEAGWQCTALDPDPRSGEHAREVVGVKTITGVFSEVKIENKYEVLTLNKVLEHVVDPIGMLSSCPSILEPEGFVYIELPDGEEAIKEGAWREEFFIDHHHVFSNDSMIRLCQLADFDVVESGRLREASGKFTLWAFLSL